MIAVPQSHALRDSLQEILGVIDANPKPSAFTLKQVKEIARQALLDTLGPDPLMAAALALALSVQVLVGELEASAKAQKAGEIWLCVDTPARLKAAREAIDNARKAGVKL